MNITIKGTNVTEVIIDNEILMAEQIDNDTYEINIEEKKQCLNDADSFVYIENN